MYAVIATSGKQYRVQPGETIHIERVNDDKGEARASGPIVFDQVLLVADGEKVQIGAPTVSGAKVTGEIAMAGLAKKVLVYKYRRRKGYRRKNGHRQAFTAVKITNISV